MDGAEIGQSQQITVTEDGPYMVEGEIVIANAGGEVVSTEGKVFLCRCGGSQNKPFCDGTHNRNGFSGTETADRGPIAKRQQAYEGTGSRSITIDPSARMRADARTTWRRCGS